MSREFKDPSLKPLLIGLTGAVSIAALAILAAYLTAYNHEIMAYSSSSQVQSVEKPAAGLVSSNSTSAPQMVEKIVEKPVYVTRIKYINRTVEVEKPVYIDRVVEKIVEKPVYLDRVVEKQVPVEVTKVVEKPVYIEKPIASPVAQNNNAANHANDQPTQVDKQNANNHDKKANDKHDVKQASGKNHQD